MSGYRCSWSRHNPSAWSQGYACHLELLSKWGPFASSFRVLARWWSSTVIYWWSPQIMKLIWIFRKASVGSLWCARRQKFRYTVEIPTLCSIVERSIRRSRFRTSPFVVHMFLKHLRCFWRVVVQVLIQTLGSGLIESWLGILLLPLLLLEAVRRACGQAAPNITDPSTSWRNYCTGFAGRLCVHST